MLAAFRKELGSLLLLAGPIILAQFAEKGLTFIDTLMVGRLGSDALAGIALGSVVFMLILILTTAVLFAVGPFVSQAYGSGDRNESGRAARQGFWLAVLLFVPGFLLLYNSAPLLLLIGQQPETVTLSSSYLRVISFGLLPALLFTSQRSFLEGIGDTRPIMVVTLLAVLLKVLANHALMFGNWGLPELGLNGTAYSTVLVYAFMLLVLVPYIGVRHRDYGIFRNLGRPDFGMMRNLLKVGIPIGLTLGFESSLFSITALLMGLFGATALAAHQIAIQTASITFMVPTGLAIATSVRVGQAVGRRDPVGVTRVGTIGVGLSVAVMCFPSLLYWLAPDLVISLYLGAPTPETTEVRQLARTFLGIAAMFQIVDGIQVSAIGALRGLKDTRVPMLLTLVAYWLLGLPTSIGLAFGLKLGGPGLWFGLVVGLTVAAIFLLERFRRERGRLFGLIPS
ncbi:MAG: MATE family efflux transporter [Trueperaceae bacterium]|nr:MAG: MATE family efflux transporter [Trueperaceae bacterium]